MFAFFSDLCNSVHYSQNSLNHSLYNSLLSQTSLLLNAYLICCTVTTQVEGAKNVEHIHQSSTDKKDKQLDMLPGKTLNICSYLYAL